jgi:hypothetical protein
MPEPDSRATLLALETRLRMLERDLSASALLAAPPPAPQAHDGAAVPVGATAPAALSGEPLLAPWRPPLAAFVALAALTVAALAAVVLAQAGGLGRGDEAQRAERLEQAVAQGGRAHGRAERAGADAQGGLRQVGVAERVGDDAAVVE